MAPSNILLESGTGEFEMVEFHLDEINASGKEYRGSYGVNVAKVLEILRPQELTPLPEVKHPAIIGAFAHRDNIVPVVDLALWLGKKAVPSDEARIMLCEFNTVITAFLVSAVSRIHRIPWTKLESDGGPGEAMSHVLTGVVRMEGRLVLFLDLEQILADISPDEDLETMSMSMERLVPPGKTYRALVAEDSPSTRKLLVSTLTRAGFTVQEFGNGGRALAELEEYARRARENRQPLTDFVHVVVTDIEMPVLDGLALTKRIRAHSVLRELPVILFSSLITQSLRHQGESVGADEQVAKPGIATLARKAVDLIHQRQRSRK